MTIDKFNELKVGDIVSFKKPIHNKVGWSKGDPAATEGIIMCIMDDSKELLIHTVQHCKKISSNLDRYNGDYIEHKVSRRYWGELREYSDTYVKEYRIVHYTSLK